MKLMLTCTIAAFGVLALVAAARQHGAAQPTPSTLDVIASRPAARAGVAGYDVAAQLSNQDLAQQSDTIVVARAVQTGIFWTADGRNLYTLVTVDVLETLKGDPVTTLVVAIPGGMDANRAVPIAVTYPAGPQLGVGEEAVLFLTDGSDAVAGSHAIAGFARGKFSIGADQMVRVGEDAVSLAAFTQEIRGYLQQ
jgi:hypothetical protein